MTGQKTCPRWTATEQDAIMWALGTGSSLAPFQIARKIRPRCSGSRTHSVKVSLWRMYRDGEPIDYRDSGCGYRWWRIDLD